MGQVQMVNLGKLPLYRRKGKGAKIGPAILSGIVTVDVSFSHFNISQKTLRKITQSSLSSLFPNEFEYVRQNQEKIHYN